MGMFESRENLPLLHESRHIPSESIPRRSSLSATRCSNCPSAPFGQLDLAHAAATEEGHENVRADGLPCGAVEGLRFGVPIERPEAGRILGDARLEERPRGLVGRQQAAHETEELGIGGLERRETGAAFLGGELHELRKQIGGLAQTRARAAAHDGAAGAARLR